MQDINWRELQGKIIEWGKRLGFDDVGIADANLAGHREHLARWLQKNRHGEMGYMSRHGDMRSRPERLHEGTQGIICVRLDYFTPKPDPQALLARTETAYVSRYALGRDYHKVLRGRLKRLSNRIGGFLTEQGYEGYSGRVVTDSAPILEKALAEKAGLGWIAKNTLIVSEQAGSWFFLGELLTNLPLPGTGRTGTGRAARNRCGSCSECIDICPTGAIVAPYQLDAKKCVSYLTIELRGAIPVELREPMGNRIFGCDDCQLVCPWNKFARPTAEGDFKPRHGLDAAALVDLFRWTEAEFLSRTEGSAIRRAGYAGWLRNIAVALGNSKPQEAQGSDVVAALKARKGFNEMVDEHIAWALERLDQHQRSRAATGAASGLSTGQHPTGQHPAEQHP